MADRNAEEVAFLKALGQEIRSCRQLRGMSRETLAKHAEISETTLGRIEREGPVDVGDTWRLADVLGMPLPVMVRRAEEVALARVSPGRLTSEQRDEWLQQVDRDNAAEDDELARRRAANAEAEGPLDADLDALPHEADDPQPIRGRSTGKAARKVDPKKDKPKKPTTDDRPDA